MAQAKQGDTVKIHYTGKFEDGTVIDTSVDRFPLEFTLGEGEVIAGLERAVLGMNAGESTTVRIAAEEGHGPYREDMVMVVDRDRLPEDLQPSMGEALEVSQLGGRTALAWVTNVTPSEVTVDANHPLAGKDLVLDIQIVEVV